MSTHAIISIIKNGNEKIHYCNQDGYPDFVGREVLNFITSHTFDDVGKFYDKMVLKSDNDVFDKENDYLYCIKKDWFEPRNNFVATKNKIRNELNNRFNNKITWFDGLKKSQGEINQLYKAYKEDGFVYVFTSNTNRLYCFEYIIDLDEKKLKYSPYGENQLAIPLLKLFDIQDEKERERVVQLYVDLFQEFFESTS